MGCDIHVLMERRYKGAWVPVNPEPYPEPPEGYDYSQRLPWGAYTEINALEELADAAKPFVDRVPSRSKWFYFRRNYEAFTQLAGVRGPEDEAFAPPKGAPDDASDQVFETLHLRVGDQDGQGVVTRKTAERWGRWSPTLRNGVEYIWNVDLHTPSWYTLEELHNHIDRIGKGDVDRDVLELTKEMFRICKLYKLDQAAVRVIFAFDN